MTNDNSIKTEAAEKQNVYEKTVLIARRAKQVLTQMRTSFLTELEKLEDIEDYTENSINSRKQLQLSKKYEKMSKPIIVAIKDATEGNLMYRYPDEN